MPLIGFGNQLVEEAIDFRKMTNNFGDADYRKIFCIDNGVAPRGSHPIAADAKELKLLMLDGRGRPRHTITQSFDQL